jgi:thioredoxin-dependent peroxiredoxin
MTTQTPNQISNKPYINIENSATPEVTFKTRVKNTEGEYEWKDITTHDLFANKKVVVFSLPGAFTPTCSSTHLPGYEAMYDEFKALGIDEIYCLSVNDTFVMNAWAKDQNVMNVKMIPDGSGEFTRKLGMLVKKENLGFGMRSWRYSMLINNEIIEKAFVEPDFGDDCPTDPFEVSDANTMLEYLQNK